MTTPIPVYDATQPITCTIADKDIGAHLELIERMRLGLERIERSEHGLHLWFPRRDDIEADVREFAVTEKGCCTFWGFEIEVRGQQLQLRWDGPPATGELVDRLLAYFQGDEPISAIEGLL